MRIVLLAFALAALGWIGWGAYQRYSPEGQQKAAEWAQVELCRDGIVADNPDNMLIAQRAYKCDKMAKAFNERWR